MAGLTKIKSDGIGDNCDLDGEGTLVLDSTNNRVGIGTTSPGTLLHLSSSDPRITLTDTDAGGNVQLRNTSGAGYLGTLGEHPFIFQTNGSERIRINSSGNVGIGTSAPSQKLHVHGTAKIGGTGSSSRVADFDTNGILTLHYGDNNNVSNLKLQNLASDATTNHGNNILWQFGTNTSETAINAAKIRGLKEQQWTSTTSTQNAALAFDTISAGSLDERMRIDSSGNVGIGTTSVDFSNFGSNTGGVAIEDIGGTNTGLKIGDGSNDNYLIAAGNGSFYQSHYGSGAMIFGVGNGTGTERMRIDSSGRMLIGGTGPGQSSADELTLISTGHTGMTIRSGTTHAGSLFFSDTTSGAYQYAGFIQYDHNVNALTLGANTNEGLRIDSSGNVVIGTTTAASNSELTLRAASPHLSLYATPGQDSRLNMGDTDDHDIGMITYANFDNSMRFTTNASERMRIDSNGVVLVGKTSDTYAAQGVRLHPISDSHFTRDNGNVAAFRRNGSDGIMLDFWKDGSSQGNISVSGSTISYNGAHLSRWSQLPGGAVRTEILRGSVLSNLDEMCEWGEEDNEQLNRMKVSDVEGDRNVSGVFQAWDDDDDTYTNDFYCAMTGDFVIRIAQGTTVARGDLLMSAGDGTAKPQDDDIVRSKTIAKVTSTNISETYSDGSYCVPCVLMAC